MPVKIQSRQLSSTEAKRFSREIANTPSITGYSRSELIKIGEVLVMESDSKALGILAFEPTNHFIDFKIFIIKEGSRHQGYGSKLFQYFLELQKDSNLPIYTVTKNPTLITMLKQSGFYKTTFIKMPAEYQLHQLKMIFSIFRLKEFFRKFFTMRTKDKFTYWIKQPR